MLIIERFTIQSLNKISNIYPSLTLIVRERNHVTGVLGGDVAVFPGQAGCVHSAHVCVVVHEVCKYTRTHVSGYADVSFYVMIILRVPFAKIHSVTLVSSKHGAGVVITSTTFNYD